MGEGEVGMQDCQGLETREDFEVEKRIGLMSGQGQTGQVAGQLRSVCKEGSKMSMEPSGWAVVQRICSTEWR